MRFTPKEDFFSPELRSHYTKGLSYTVRSGPKYDKLRELSKKWLAEGKIVESFQVAEVSGSDAPPPTKSLLKRIFPWL